MIENENTLDTFFSTFGNQSKLGSSSVPPKTTAKPDVDPDAIRNGSATDDNIEGGQVEARNKRNPGDSEAAFADSVHPRQPQAKSPSINRTVVKPAALENEAPALEPAPPEVPPETDDTTTPVQSEPDEPTIDVQSGDVELSRQEREARRLARLEQHREATRRAAQARVSRPQVPRPTMSTTSSSETKRATTTTPAATVFEPTSSKPKPARLRLDPVQEEVAPPPKRRFGFLRSLFTPLHQFYDQCPNCKSTEIYGVNERGEFLIHESERSPVYQRFQCERCISAFARPGAMLGAPPPRIRPADCEMYG